LVAVADLIPERATTIAEKYDIPKWYDNHHDLNSDPNVDAVIITATTMNHKEIVLDAVAERKPIFCEKPMSLSIDDARAMKSAVEAHGVFYQQGYMRRFDKGFAADKFWIWPFMILTSRAGIWATLKLSMPSVAFWHILK